METAQGEKQRERERKGKPEGGTSSKARRLKGKVSLHWKKPGDNALIYFNKNRVPPQHSPSPDQRAQHLYAGDGLTLIIKKRELKNKN